MVRDFFEIPALPLEIIIAEAIFQSLRRNKWNAAKAAAELDINIRTIRIWKHKLKKLGFELGTYSSKGTSREQYKQPQRTFYRKRKSVKKQSGQYA